MKKILIVFALFPLLSISVHGVEIRGTIKVWPGKAPDEPAGIEAKKAEAVTGSDGVIRIPYVDTP